MHDLRRWTDDVHRTVDDTPYGGGPGMVMLAEPWGRALDEIAPAGLPIGQPRLLIPTPAGRPFTQAMAARSGRRALAAVRLRTLRGHRRPGADYAAGGCGRRGQPRRLRPVRRRGAVLVIIEAVSRLLPGVLGNAESAATTRSRATACSNPRRTRSPRPGGARRPRCAAVRQSRRDRPLASRAVAPAHCATPARPARLITGAGSASVVACSPAPSARFHVRSAGVAPSTGCPASSCAVAPPMKDHQWKTSA